jgi:hypothetical protein
MAGGLLIYIKTVCNSNRPPRFELIEININEGLKRACTNVSKLLLRLFYLEVGTVRSLLRYFKDWEKSSLEVVILRVACLLTGLDEYEGEHLELITTFRAMTQSPNIKICAASRPWQDFKEVFDPSQWRIYIEDPPLWQRRGHMQYPIVCYLVVSQKFMARSKCRN